MADQSERTESLAAICARLMAGPSKRVRKIAARSSKPAKPTSRELWQKTYAKLNAEAATPEAAALPDNVLAARKRAFQRTE